MQKILKVFLILNLVFAGTVQVYGKDPFNTKDRHTSTPPLACPTPGSYTIGPAGDYVSIGVALSELASCPSLTGAYIFEFTSTYNSTVETFPVTIPNFTGSSAANTITFRPQLGATALSITSANTTGTLLFDGGDYIIFDGRPGGVGTAKELTIQNTNAGNSYAMRFVNDATHNNISYCVVRSANNNAAGATIILSGTNGTEGNDHITIDNNDIRDVSLVATPNNAILSAGSTGTPALYNNNIVISNNNILNFYNTTGNIAGVIATQGSSDWIISGNNFNHTFSGTPKSISGSFSVIDAYNTQMENFTINNNFIGGTSALTSGGNINIIGSGVMRLFNLSLNPAVVNNINGNTIWNIIYITSQSSPLHSVFNLADGAYNVGTVAGNIIGSPTTQGNIALVIGGFGATNNFAIINCGAGGNMGTVTVSNNFISNIDMAGTSPTAGFQLINFTGSTGTYTISSNILGSSSRSPSINHFRNTIFAAISGNMSAGTHTISNNSINNLWERSTGTTALLYGIWLRGSASYTASSNTVSGLKSYNTNASFYSAIGISNTATAGNQLISKNVIRVLSTDTSNSRIGLAGIYYNGPVSGTNVVEQNFIHSFSPNTTDITSPLVGIHVIAGTTTYKNNMVRQGINSAGGSITNAFQITGILEEGGINDFYFNSIYIGGNNVGAGQHSYAFNSSISGAVSRNYRNNIFFNARSNAAGSSPSHYAIRVAAATGVISDFNVLYATGTGNILANFAGSNVTTLAGWRTSIGGDANSYSADPQFILPAGSSATVDLHIKPSPVTTIVESNGTVIASITDDFDNQARSSFTPTDIGADAANLAAVSRADIGPVSIFNPTVFACNTTGVQVRVTIKNYNNTTINFAASPVTVTAAITGAITTNLSGIINTGTLAAGDSIVVTLSGTLDMSAAGSYDFNISTSVGGGYTDLDVTNNTYSTSVTPSPYNTGTLSSSVANFCNSGIPVLTLSGTFGTVQWQESTVSSSGPWTNVGSNTLVYSPVSITATTYFQAVVSCGVSSGPGNVEMVLVIPASIANTAALVDGAASVTICEGSSITLTQSGGSIVPGASWQWYEGTVANNFITPVGPSLTSADASLIITPTASANYYLRASGGTAPCDGNVPAASTGNPVAAVTVKLTGTWLGNNTSWNDNTNWCGGLVPTASTDAIIPTGLVNYPLISTIQDVRNITIQPGASLTINVAGELSIKGNYTNTAGIITNNGRIVLNGSNPQSFPGSTATVGAMNILEVDNISGVNFDQSFSISGKLQPVNGTVSLNNSDITIKSDAFATASVGPVGSGASFNYNGTGKFIVERFIPARRAWRLLTAPVTAASGGSINSNWQEAATKWPMGPATPASNPNDGFGVHISGGTNANGYDQNVNGNSSIRVFSAGAWNGLPVSTSLYTQKVTDEPGYMLFVRGSRAVDLTFGTFTVPDNTVLRTSGHLKVANNTPVSITSTGITVLGNPFASAINFNSIAAQNGFSLGENKFYMWDPTLTGSYGAGAWVTLAYNGSSYDRTVSSLNDYPSSGGSQGIDNIGTIQSGAAVMVDFGATPKTINLNETIKVDGSTSMVFRPAPAVSSQLRANLYVDHNNSVSLIDGVLVNFKRTYNNNVDDLDVNKYNNASENLGLRKGGKIFAIERRKPVSMRDTIFLNTSQMRARNYQLAFEPDNMVVNNLACYLEDTYLNIKIPVSLKQRTIVPFSVTDDASAAWERFRLLFRKWHRFINCEALYKNENVTVKWEAAEEDNLDTYEIERSEDGVNFSVVGRVAGRNHGSTSRYTFSDGYTNAGIFYYRIKATSKQDVINYSSTARVAVLKGSAGLYVFPNPVVDNKVVVQISSKMPTGEYRLTLLSPDGKIITANKMNHPGGSNTFIIAPSVRLTSGIYQLNVLLPDNTNQLVKVMVK
ncbi:MAG TPA: hypothetical protein PLY34_03330 [Ferruginibacter sp.]|nr:hypothetical protein [Ferruginibacter sp.]